MDSTTQSSEKNHSRSQDMHCLPDIRYVNGKPRQCPTVTKHKSQQTKKNKSKTKHNPGQYCSPTTMVIILSMGLLMGPKNTPPSLGLDLVTTVLPWSCHAAASFLTPFATDPLFVSCACHISSWGAEMRVGATLIISHSNQHERVGMRVDATLIKAHCNQH